MKKIVLFFFLAGIIALSAWFFFIQETYRNPIASVAPIEAIPQNAPIVLTFDDFFQLRYHIAKMPYAEEISDVFFVKKMSEDFNAIRKLFSKDKNHRQLLLDARITTSLHLSGKNNVDFLYVIDDQKKIFSLEELLKVFPYKKSQSKRNTVYQLTLNDGSKFTVANYNNLLLVSRYAYLVETGMQQLKNPATNLLNQYQLDYSNKKSENPFQVKVFTFFENFKAFATPFLNPKPIQSLNDFSKKVGFSKVVLDFQEEGVLMNGNLKPNRENYFLEKLFDNSKITKSNVADILPQNISYFFRHSIQGKKQFKSKSNSVLFEEYFKPWINEEWLTGRTQIFTRKMKSEKFVAYQMKNLKMAQYHLEKLSDSVGLIKNWEHQTYPIQQILLEELPIPFSKGEFVEMQNPCYTFIEDYVLFAKSPRIIENWIDKFVVNQTLARNITFLKMKNKSGGSEVTEFYWNQRSAQKFFKNALSNKDIAVQEQIDYWKNFTLGINGKWKNNQMILNGYLFYQKEAEETAEVKWKIPLHAEAHTSPFALYNEEKESYDILIQDIDNRLYLFNSEGEEEWNMLLEAPILSEIVAGNFVENQPAIIIFNTKDKIHQIDFEGENINNFPLELSAKAVNGLLLADFSEREYGVFLACENQKIYGFDIKGKPFSGWQSIEEVGKVSIPLKHFQTEHKDYLVVFNDKGDIFSFDKNGFKTTEGFGIATTSDQPLCFQVQQNEDDIMIADPLGYQRSIDLEGEPLGLSQNKVLPKTDIQYTSADLAGDNQTDFVVLNKDQLQIYYNHKNDFEQYGKFRFLNIPDQVFSVQSKNMGKAMIGAVDQKQEQIFLIDKKGNLDPNFPLGGTTSFQLVNLFSENKNVVLVANKDQVVVYELP